MNNSTQDAKAASIPLYSAPLLNKSTRTKRANVVIGLLCAILFFTTRSIWLSRPRRHPALQPFFHNISDTSDLCVGPSGKASSRAGYIALDGDSMKEPKRSFFWLFNAENDPENAPIILSIGGGPGTSGLLNPLFGQSHCILTEDGIKPNPNRWTEHFNLLALDHPIGAGYSVGPAVDTSFEAAIQVYDFLQKFFRLYPHLSENKFIISSGSYGGIYVPNIASRINLENKAIARGEGRPGAVHINLESMVVSNPRSDPISYFRWMAYYRCEVKQVYNTSTCATAYAALPKCLEDIELLTYSQGVAVDVGLTFESCAPVLIGDMGGSFVYDVRRKCSVEDLEGCFPAFSWAKGFFNSPHIKDSIGVSRDFEFQPTNIDVAIAFMEAHDPERPHHLLYEPLLKDGIRLLHWIGAQDAACSWPGVLGFLKQLRTPFQKDFITGVDVPWPGFNATVRTVGEGAGDMTFILMEDAGHFVVGDQPVLAKEVIEHWIWNIPYPQ